MTQPDAAAEQCQPLNAEDGLPATKYVFVEQPEHRKMYNRATLEHPEGAAQQVKVYRKRWAILALSFLTIFMVMLPWVQYAIIANVLMDFYGVSNTAIEWTTLVYSAAGMVFSFPSIWFANKYGLRPCFLIGAGGAALSQWLKVLGSWPDRFWLLFLGQIIQAACFSFPYVGPPKLAATWFPASELSTALGTAYNGELVGIAVGCAIAPLSARMDWTQEQNIAGLFYVHTGLAVAASALLVAVFFFLENKPPLPPSPAQAAAEALAADSSFLRSMKRIVRNRHFLLLSLGMVMVTSVLIAVRTLMNRTIVELFPEHSDQAGWLGTIITISGPVGILATSYILDKTKLYKEMAVGTYVALVLSTIGYTLTFAFGTITVLYITTTLLGVFIAAVYIPGYEFAIELNYPEPAGNPTSILLWLFMPSSLVLTTLSSLLFDSYGAMAGMGCMCALLVLGLLAVILVPKEYKRRAAEQALALEKIRKYSSTESEVRNLELGSTCLRHEPEETHENSALSEGHQGIEWATSASGQ